MKFVLTASLIAVSLLAGCASSPAVSTGMSAGKFVSFACEGGKTFSARASEDGKTIRVRGHQGSAELDMKTDGVYEGEGYMLMTKGKDGVSLTHSGAPMGKSCKPA